MILADLLYTLSQRVIIHDHWSSDLIHMTIATVASTTAFLLAKLYLSHRTGHMNFCAGAGAVSTYMVIAWAQLVAISTPSGPHDLTALNLGVLAAVTLSLVGTLQAMDIHLFRHSEPKPGRIGRALDTLDRIDQGVVDNAGKLDAIDHAARGAANHLRGRAQPRRRRHRREEAQAQVSQVVHPPSRLRRLAQWVANKPETTAWVAFCVTVIAAIEVADHVLHWW